MRAMAARHDGEGWRVDTGEAQFKADTLLIAIPAEQAHDLLAEPAPDLASIPASVQSAPCWAAMAAFAEPIAYAPDSLRSKDGAIAWAARNSAKPARAAGEAWVLHASPARSRELIEAEKTEAAAALLTDFFDQTGISPAVPIHLDAHRWLYAMPEPVEGEPARFDAGARIGIAGDYLHSPRVEGAFLSGNALAEKVLASD
jgi:hypothetical protein